MELTNQTGIKFAACFLKSCIASQSDGSVLPAFPIVKTGPKASLLIFQALLEHNLQGDFSVCFKICTIVLIGFYDHMSWFKDINVIYNLSHVIIMMHTVFPQVIHKQTAVLQLPTRQKKNLLLLAKMLSENVRTKTEELEFKACHNTGTMKMQESI